MTPHKIILHHSLTTDSGTVSWNAIRKYHVETLGWKDIGYQFGIELVGNRYEVLVGRMMNEIGAHTVGQNSNSIGICFVGNFDDTEVPVEQWALGVRLVRCLCQVFGIQSNEIHGHKEYAVKSCPGKLFDVWRFRSDVMNPM